MAAGRLRASVRGGRILRAVHRSPLARPLRAAARRGVLPPAMWLRLPASGRFRVATHRSSFEYEALGDDQFVRRMFWVGMPAEEPESTGLFEAEVIGATTVVDVGANRGLYTLSALAASPTVRVVAVEPSPATFEHLRAAVALNGWSDRVELVAAAAADAPGTLPFHVPATPLATSARLVAAAHRSAITGTVIDVPIVTIDDVVPAAEVVKIDVEGAEHLVLAGMRRLLATSRPVVFLEVLPEARNAECQEILEAAGYRFFHLTPEGPVSRPGLIPDPSRKLRNYVCRPG